MAALKHVYKYSHHSELDAGTDGLRLRLAAEVRPEGEIQFFQGDVLDPLTTARCLRAVSDLVGTRFYVPPSMLARILREADPVATVGDAEVRFEGFSACCSTYIRHDIDGGGYSAERLTPGTTNVDFGADMRAALAKVRAETPLRLSVRSDSVELESDSESVVEKRVELPLRWIKGFAEVQAHLADMNHKISLPKVQAQKFLRSLPRSQADHEQWVTATARGARLSVRPADSGVMIKGTQRLRLFEKLAAAARSLEVYSSVRHGSSAWVLDFGSQRLTLVLNSEPWRGFSGDGQLLSSLAGNKESALASVKAQLNWQSKLNAGEVAKATGHTQVDVDRAFANLASQGLLGYDLQSGSYFHRVLPFDLDQVTKLNPRLKSARALIDNDAIQIERDGDEIRADVASNGVTHQVRLSRSASTCTCPWFAKNQGKRGPCKHILAAELKAEQPA